MFVVRIAPHAGRKMRARYASARYARIEKVLAEIHEETRKSLAESAKADEKIKKTLADIQEETRKSLAEGAKADEKIRKTLADIHEETRKSLAEGAKADEKIKQTLAEIAIAHRETEKTLNKAIGGLGKTLGTLVERTMTPDLPRKFRELGFSFNRITMVKLADGVDNIYAEIDGLLENGSQAMVVEVKATLRRKDVDDHLERMEKVRKYASAHGDDRAFFGAMAATIIDKDTRRHVLASGFFLIEPSGEDVVVTRPVSHPKVW